MKNIKNKLIFDISAIFDLKDGVTGISRVILTLIKEISNSDYEVVIIGISFRNEYKGYKLHNYNEIVENSLGFLDKKECKEKEINIDNNDILLLWGEQWLFSKTIPLINEIKLSNKINIISMIYDLVPLFMPELYWKGFSEEYKRTIDFIVNISDSFLAISNNTKKDLEKYYSNKIIGKEITVIKLGDDICNSYRQERILNDKYILVVSTVQPRKNHMLLLNVWRRLINEYSYSDIPNLKIVGQKGWNVEEFYYFVNNNPILKSKIEFVDSISDKELDILYSNATFTIYPSLYEGWGLPICESLSYGKLCLSSSSSSMKEAGGEFCDYFSPYDSGELYNLIVKYYFNINILKKKEDYIIKNYKKTIWKDTMEECLTVIKKVLNEN